MISKKWISKQDLKLDLRNYQLEAWDKLWSNRPKRALIQLATGLGKTYIAAIDVLHYKTEVDNPKVLFVSHMNDISEQSMKTFLSVSNFSTQIYKSKMELKDVDITFTTFQSLLRNLDKINPDFFSYIIYDEAHHLEAVTFKKVREHFNPKFELGLTATPERADGLDIFDYFGEPLYSKTLADGLVEGWLSQVDYHIVFDETIKEAMKNDFNLTTVSEIKNLFAIRPRNEMISAEVLQRRHNIGMDKAKTIVFCQNRESAEEMAKLLKGKPYHSLIDKDIRISTLKEFRSGSLQVICTVDMFNEGIDIPDARLIVFLRSTSSRTVFEQQLGRGLRKSPNKQNVTVLDFVANVERISFVRELGRHVADIIRKPRGPRSDGVSSNESSQVNGYIGNFDISTFEFEDQTIELLDRYNALRNIEYLNPKDVVEAFEELKSVRAVAEKFSVSDTAIYKHLKKAGIDTSGAMIKDKIPMKLIIDTYFKLGSSKKAGDALGISSSTVLHRIRKAGLKTFPPTKRRFKDQELIEAYEKNNRNLRKTAIYLDIDRGQLMRHMRRAKIDTSRKIAPLPISESELQTAFQKHDGDLESLIKEFEDKSTRNYGKYTLIYKALDRYGYIDKPQSPLRNSVAAAAYYKYGTSVKAGEALGVSSTYISMLTRKANAKFIKKYKSKSK